MIWFKVKKLEKGLADGNISDKEGFNYLLINLIMCSIVPYLSINDHKNKWLLILEVTTMVIMTVFGVKKTFDINENGDSKDFFKRFLSLSFVNGIRLVVFVAIAAIPLGIITYIFENTIGNNKNVKDICSLTLIIITTFI